MRNFQSTAIMAVAACLVALSGGTALAQKSGSGLVCWKDKTGKTVGCGDKVPPEYQDNANSTLNKRGVTVDQTDAVLTPEQRQAQKADAERKKIDEQKREEDKRHDRALLDSFTNEKEIDLKRTRDIQQIEINISAQQSLAKSLTDRQNDLKAKLDQAKKDNRPIPPAVQQEYDKLTAEIAKSQDSITQKRKEIADKNVEYDAMKKRFIELKGGSTAPATATTVPAKK